MQLTEKAILITGGNSGIGLQLVKRLHAMKNTIIVASRTQNRWKELKTLQPQIELLQADLSSKEQVLQLVQQLQNKAITLDIVVNCAAIQNTPMLIDEASSFDDIAPEVTTNFIAPVWLSHLLLPQLLSRPTAMIVNLSSGLAFYPKRTSAVYCATKAALHNFSQSLRYQLMGTPVHIAEVILPLVDTPMTKGRGSGKVSAKYAAQEIVKGMQKDKNEIYIGKARMLPLMMRIWPDLVKRILQRY